MKAILHLAVTLFLISSNLCQAQIQRVRVNVTTPDGYVRQLLLGFTPDNAASDDVDYGYDAANPDTFNNDASWIINNQPYVIQGVGEFDIDKTYPIGLFLSDSGDISFNLFGLENFQNDINVYIYDAQEDSYTAINDVDFNNTVTSGNHTDRFFIAFKDNALSISDFKPKKNIEINVFNNNLNVTSTTTIHTISIYNVLGKLTHNINNIKTTTKRIDISHLNKGIYIVKVVGKNKLITTKKIIIN